MAWLLMLALTTLLSVSLCFAYRHLALKYKLLDLPNQRSSHHLPTPHGGGVAIILAFSIAMVIASSVPFSADGHSLGSGWSPAYVLIAGVALLLSALGVIDDKMGLSIRLRLVLYGIACVGTVAAFFGLLPALLDAPSLEVSATLPAVLAVAFVMLWLVNLFNFMDGIDGIAALETLTVCALAAGLAYLSGADTQYVLFCLLLSAAHLGFLVLNWEPAKLFMGDAGSIATGFMLGALVLLGQVTQALNPYCWLILLAVFIVDASWTLGWRMVTGQAFTQAHRTHAYQRLSRHFGSHAKVDLIVLAINLLWLAPLALAVVVWPQHALILVILAYLPLLAGMAKMRRLP